MKCGFWTEAKRMQVVFMVEQGYRNGTIARHFGVQNAQVAHIINKWEREHGPIKRQVAFKRGPIGEQEPPRIVMSLPAAPPKLETLPEANLTPAERARRMASAGHSQSYIAAMTRLPWRTVDAISKEVRG